MERDCHIKNVLIWGTSCKQNVEKFSSLWGICCKQNIENILMWSISCKQNVQKVSTVMLFQLKTSFYKILWFSNFIVVSHSVLITEDNIPGGACRELHLGPLQPDSRFGTLFFIKISMCSVIWEAGLAQLLRSR